MATFADKFRREARRQKITRSVGRGGKKEKESKARKEDERRPGKEDTFA